MHRNVWQTSSLIRPKIRSQGPLRTPWNSWEINKNKNSSLPPRAWIVDFPYPVVEVFRQEADRHTKRTASRQWEENT